MWEIITYSDSIVINSVFNAIAVIFSDGIYTGAAIVVSLAMIMGMAVTTVAGAQKEMPFAKWFSSALIFAFGFATTTKVAIENRNTGAVDVIDNIPLVVAAPASIITQVSFHLTEMTETAFGNTDGQRITVNGYMSPLVMLANYRKITMFASCPAGDSNSTINGIRLCPTLTNHARDCSAVKFAQQGAGFANNQVSALDMMHFDSAAHSTIIMRDDLTTLEATCRDAWTIIRPLLDGTDFDAMVESNKNQLGKANSTETLTEQLQQNLDAITNGAVNARKLSQAIFTVNNMIEGTQAFLHKVGANAMAENFISSVQQRNYAWAVQGDLFVSIIDTFLKLMEAIMYSIVPFIGLMVLTGSMGIRSLAMYMQVLIVFQFIPIMLVIVQNLILKQASDVYLDLSAKHYDSGSYEFMMTFTREMNELAGLGGMLAATVVPAVALALVTGSNYALVGAIKGIAAPAKDTDFAPQHVNQGGAMHNLGSITSTEAKNGTHFNENAYANLAEIDVKRSLGDSVRKTQLIAQEAEQNFEQALSNSGIAEYMEGKTQEEMRSMGTQIMAGKSAQALAIQDSISTMTKQHSYLDTVSAEIAAELYAQVSAGEEIDFGFLKADAEMGAKLHGSLTGSQSESLNNFIDSDQVKKLSQEFTEKYEEARVEDLLNHNSISMNDSYIQSKNNTIQEAFNEKTKTQEEFERTSKISETLEVSSSNDKVLVNKNLANNADSYQRIKDFYSNMSPKERAEVQDEMALFDSGLHTFDDKEILTASMLKYLSEKDETSDDINFILTGNTLFLNDRDEEESIKPTSIFEEEDRTTINDIDNQATESHIISKVNKNQIQSEIEEPINNVNVKTDGDGKIISKMSEEFKETAKKIEAEETKKVNMQKARMDIHFEHGDRLITKRDESISVINVAGSQAAKFIPDSINNILNREDGTIEGNSEVKERVNYLYDKKTEETQLFDKEDPQGNMINPLDIKINTSDVPDYLSISYDPSELSGKQETPITTPAPKLWTPNSERDHTEVNNEPDSNNTRTTPSDYIKFYSGGYTAEYSTGYDYYKPKKEEEKAESENNSHD